jgi:hypothetical protein
MALRTLTQTQADAHSGAIKECYRIRIQAANLSSFTAANNVSANAIIDIFHRMTTLRGVLDSAAAVPGIAAYAQSQYDDDPSYDVVAEFQAVRAQAQATIDWIVGNFPKASGQDYILKDELTDNGIAVRAFTPAQTASLRTVLDAFVATVEG